LEHYFTSKSTTELKTQHIEFQLHGKNIRFTTSNAVFSKGGVDYGSRVLLETLTRLEKPLTGKILDVGCGYGAIGITLLLLNQEIVMDMVDVNERALELAQVNASANQVADRARIWLSDQLAQVSDCYQSIVTNPPIRAGKAVVHGIYTQSYDSLVEGGRLFVVIQKKQGAPSTIKALEALFGNCKIINKDAGYYILCATKETVTPPLMME
jgi:16S rRNA (guanine1207-N2)-methyltransferase